MTAACPYPGCTLENEHYGNHSIPRSQVPTGELRLLQKFEGCTIAIHCDLDPDELHRGEHEDAAAFYADDLGYGWAICGGCMKSLSATGLAPAAARRTRRPRPAAKPAEIPVPAAVKPAEVLPPQPAAKSNVVEMRRAR